MRKSLPECLDRIIELSVVLQHLPHILHVAVLDLVEELGEPYQVPVGHVAVPLGEGQCIVGIVLGGILVPVNNNNFFEVTVEAV